MMKNTNEIIGYRVMYPCTEEFVGYNPEVCDGNYLTPDEPEPIPRGDAFRRLAAFLDEYPDFDHTAFTIEPVYRELTPLERTARELGGQLKSLCDRHGLDLGLTQEQMEAAIDVELRMFTSLGLTGLR